MKRPGTAIIISASVVLIGVSLAETVRSQEISTAFPWITQYGSWSLADERDRPYNRLSGFFRPISYSLSLRNSNYNKNYKLGLSCIRGIIRFEVDASNLSEKIQKSAIVTINDIEIDVVSRKTTFEGTETLNSGVRNGFVEGEADHSMLEYLKNQKRIDLAISSEGFNERHEIPIGLTSEAASAFISLCEKVNS